MDQLAQMTQYLVTGIIVNNGSGPLRWANWYKVNTSQDAEMQARADVSSLYSNGIIGQLWVSGVWQLDADGVLQCQDTYATYADNPDRPVGQEPPGGYTPPLGFEGRTLRETVA